MLKKFCFVVALSYTLALTIASLVQLSDMPEVKIDHADKIFHFVAYAILCGLWFIAFQFTLNTPYKKALLQAIKVSIVFGLLIEVLQDTVTNHRSLDIYDAIANSLGALLAGAVIILKQKIQVKNR